MGVNGIYGLSGSGIDVESMVKVGMMSKQNEYDKMAQKYTKNEWTKAEYLKLNSSITTFNMSTLSQYKMSANMNAKSADSSSSALKVVANASAPVMSHTVQVNELSSNAYLIGVDGVTRKNESAPNSIKLSDVLFIGEDGNDGITENSDDSDSVNVRYGDADSPLEKTFRKTDTAIKFTLSDGTGDDANKATISFTYGDILNGATLNDVVSKINNLSENIKATYDSVNDRFSFYNREGGAANQIIFTLDDINDEDGVYADHDDAEEIAVLNARDFLNGLNLMQSRDGSLYTNALTYDDDEEKYVVAATYSYDTQTKLYTDTATGITYNPETQIFTDSKTGIYYSVEDEEYYTADGEAYEPALDEDTGEQIGPDIPFAVPENAPVGVLQVTLGGSAAVAGTNGSITVDGISYETTDNKVTAGGITYTATAKTDSPATVTVSQDVDSIVSKVKSFIEDYNKLLAGLYEKYDEKPETGYAPLTQSQKDSMKEEQITKWEEKAQKGLLYHDSTLGKIINEMRESISTPLENGGKYNSAYSIGISTTGLKGQLTLNEDKLRAALADDSDAVYNVFAKLDNSQKDNKGNVIDNPEGNGIAQRLGDILTTATKSIRSRAGSTTDVTEDSDLNTLLRQLQTKMSNFKKMMTSFETALYKKYDSMESTLAKLGTQLNFIMGGNQ